MSQLCGCICEVKPARKCPQPQGVVIIMMLGFRVQVRMIIPGHIGGRMVKWLEEIEVTDRESQNHYHFHDNRVLPSHVDEALAKAEGELCLCTASLVDQKFFL